jgi:anti-anti-sigma regulatory factor
VPAALEPIRHAAVGRQVLGERTCVIRAEGRFTARVAIAFAAELADALEQDGCHDFVLDLSEVDSVDSIGAMIFCEQRLKLVDCSVVIAARHPEAIVGLADAPIMADWPLRSSLADALATLLLEPVA